MRHTARGLAASVSLSAAVFRAGLCFALGLPFRAAPYRCPNCGTNADPAGTHAVCCQPSGHKTRAHTALRQVVARLFQEDGFIITAEAPVAGMAERPADLVMHNWNSRPPGNDFTFTITITILSTRRPLPRPPCGDPSIEGLLDCAALAKMRKNRVPCARAGWVCRTFVCDILAIRSGTRGRRD